MSWYSTTIVLIFLPTILWSGNLSRSHHERNHIAIFGGETILEGHTYPSIGVDYERLLTHHFGIITMGEEIFGEHPSSLGGIGVSYHPFINFKICILEGYEYVYSHGIQSGHGDLLTRINFEYAFHYSELSISPAFDMDYRNGQISYVSGLAVGTSF